jgi:hypothetical protein
MPRSSLWAVAGLLLAAGMVAVVWKHLPGPDPTPAAAAPASVAEGAGVMQAAVAAAGDEGMVPAVSADVVQAWQALSPTQRTETRARYAALSGLTEGERAQLAQAAARFDALPAAEQEKLRATFSAQDRLVQRGWRLGPDLGADYARLHPLLAFVPETQHAALMQAVRAMTRQERESLAVLIQRTPPQDRHALRTDLLAMPQDRRGQWLASRLQH